MPNDDTTKTEPHGNGSANPTNTTTRPDTPQGPGSDGEDERSARERLKKTSIANLPQQIVGAADNALSNSVTEDNGVRGRPAKKRSFEDLARDEADSDTAGPDAVGQPPSPKSGHHKRMRSRDVASGEHPPVKFDNNTTQTVHEETGIDAQKSPGGPAVLIDTPSQEEMDNDDAERRNHEKATATATGKIEPTSGFANISNASPFSTSNSKSPENSATSAQPQSTSSSAFATSGLSAFASSNSSPFGSATSKPRGFGSSTSGGFGAASSTTGFGAPASSGFGNTSSTSAFGTTATSTFGAPRPFGSSTPSSFGSSRPSAFGSATSIKPFGTPAPFANSSTNSFGTSKPFGSSAKDDEDTGADDNEQEDDGEGADEPTEQDPRFHEQHIDTGEEDEDVYFSSRAKLYHFETEWKERGTGVIKINLRYVEESLPAAAGPSSTAGDADKTAAKETDDDPEAQASKFTTMKRKARLLMRADGVHRVILNSPVFKGMKFGTREGEIPLGRIMYLQSLGEDGTPRLMQVKVGKEETMKELWHKLRELEEEA